MNFSVEYGCEFYEGDADVIGAAISVADWPALRNGTAAYSSVGFPRFIQGCYFDWFAAAVASVLQKPEVQLHDLRTVAGEDGHWSADVLPVDWVAAAASVPAERIWLLGRHWRESYLRQNF